MYWVVLVGQSCSEISLKLSILRNYSHRETVDEVVEINRSLFIVKEQLNCFVEEI